MKAEQRKELETNTLADKMGHYVQKVKEGTRRTVLIYLAVAAGILVAIWAGYKWYVNDRLEASFAWVRFHDGSRGNIDALSVMDAGEASKAARFQIAWYAYWETGIKLLGAQPQAAIESLKVAERKYSELAELCKDDPIFLPQALLGKAVCAESLAVQNNDNLKKAEKYYEEITTVNEGKYKDSAEGKFAQERLKQLKDAKSGDALKAEYQKLRVILNVRDELPPNHPALFKDKGP